MPANCVEITDALQLIRCPPEKAAELHHAGQSRLWLDLQPLEPAEFEGWLDRLGVTGLSRRLCLVARDRAGFYPLKDEILLVIPALVRGDESPGIVHVTCLCREDLLVTVHDHSVPGDQVHAILQDAQTWLPEGSVAGLTAALMMGLSLDCLRRTVALRGTIVALDERMDRAPDTVEPEEIINRRSELLTIGAVVSDQLPIVKSLSETDKAFFQFGEAREYMNCAVTNLQAADVSMDWLGQRLDALRVALQMNQQDKTNHRLGMLTVLSAIFMPITLMAGIWGMNFEAMPELSLRFGYPLALGLMVAVAVGMFRYFRKHGWFG